MIDIKGIDKVALLRALYADAKPLGLGYTQYIPGPLLPTDARRMIDNGQTYFDYVFGRVLKVDLSGDSLDPRLYDRDNGSGAAASAVAGLIDEMTRPEMP